MKRFTETTKWKDPWFRSLSPAHKLFWLYLCDECDIAGFIDPDMDLASFMIGAPLALAEIMTAFNGRLEVQKSGKWRLTKFVAFQFGELNESNPCHRGVLKLLKQRSLEGPSMELGRGFQAPQDKEKEKRKEKEEGIVKGRFVKPTLEELQLAMAKAGLPEAQAQIFLNHYESNGWRVGRNPMRSWQHAVGNWKARYDEQRVKNHARDDSPGAISDRFTAGDGQEYIEAGLKL